MIATKKPLPDRLPQQIDPRAYYVNIDPRQPPRDPTKALADTVALIIFDGSNGLEVGELAGRCEGTAYGVLVLAPQTLAHIDGDVFGIQPEAAYVFDGQLWRPTPDLIDAIREIMADDRRAVVLHE